jgi:hypothetical protein
MDIDTVSTPSTPQEKKESKDTTKPREITMETFKEGWSAEFKAAGQLINNQVKKELSAEILKEHKVDIIPKWETVEKILSRLVYAVMTSSLIKVQEILSLPEGESLSVTPVGEPDAEKKKKKKGKKKKKASGFVKV